MEDPVYLERHAQYFYTKYKTKDINTVCVLYMLQIYSRRCNGENVCWKICLQLLYRILDAHRSFVTERSEDVAIGEGADLEITNNIRFLLPERVRMSVADLLNPVGEDLSLQEEDDVGIVADIVGSLMRETVEGDEGNEYLSVMVQLPSAQEQLRALASMKRILEYLNLDSVTVLQVLRKAQGAVRSTILSKAKQSTIDQSFK